MTREEVVKWLESLKRETGKAENRTLWHYAESIDMAIKALKEKNRSDSLVRDEVDACKESESKLDLISRADAIEVLMETMAPPSVTLDTLVIRIDALPSAEAIHKPDYSYEAGVVRRLKEALSAEAVQGEWVEEDEYSGLWVCDQCGFASEYMDNFCPNCGAKMTPYKGGDDE